MNGPLNSVNTRAPSGDNDNKLVGAKFYEPSQGPVI